MLGRVHTHDDLATPDVAHPFRDHCRREGLSVTQHPRHVVVAVQHVRRRCALVDRLVTEDRRVSPESREVRVRIPDRAADCVVKLFETLVTGVVLGWCHSPVLLVARARRLVIA